MTFLIKRKFLSKIDEWRNKNDYRPPPGLSPIGNPDFKVPFPMTDADGIVVQKLGFRPITSYSGHIDKKCLRVKSRVLRGVLHKMHPGLNIRDPIDLAERLKEVNRGMEAQRRKERDKNGKVFERVIFVKADISNYFKNASRKVAKSVISKTLGTLGTDGWSTNMRGRILGALANKRVGERVDKYQTRMNQGKGHGRYRGGWKSVEKAFENITSM